MLSQMFRKIFYFIFLVGLLALTYVGYSTYRYFNPAEAQKSSAVQPSSQALSPTHNTSLPVPGQAQAVAAKDRDSNTKGYDFQAWKRSLPPLDPAVIAILSAPGLLLWNRLGLGAPKSALTWTGIGLFSWWVYGTSIRLGCILPMRHFGIGYSPRSFRYWLMLTAIPWRPLFKVLYPVIHWRRLLRIGERDTDRWASFLERALCTFKAGQLLIGRQSWWFLPAVQPLGISTERGATVVASPGSGKTSWLTAHISMWPGNFVLMDPDGSVYRTLAAHLRRQGKQVFLLDPLGQTGEPTAHLNPLDEIACATALYGEDCAVEFAAVLAEGLIQETHGTNAWVAKDARAFLKSLILYIYRYAEPEQRNPAYLRRLLTLGEIEKARPQDDPLFTLFASMRLKLDDWDGAIASGAEMMRRSFSKSDGRSIPLSYCIEQTQWLDIPSAARMSERSDFAYLDLKARKDICAFLALPLQAIAGPLAGWARVFFTQTMYAFQRDTKHRQKFPTALCADEAGMLDLDKKLTTLAQAGLRKSGLVCYWIFQSISQMKEDASIFLGLSEVNLFLQTNDQATLDFVSQALGTATKTQRVPGNWPFKIGPRHQLENRKLASPGQVKLLLKDHVIAVRASAPAILAKPIRHYQELSLRWLSPHSFYREKSRARAFTRRVLAFFTRKQDSPAQPSIHDRKDFA